MKQITERVDWSSIIFGIVVVVPIIIIIMATILFLVIVAGAALIIVDDDIDSGCNLGRLLKMIYCDKVGYCPCSLAIQERGVKHFHKL